MNLKAGSNRAASSRTRLLVIVAAISAVVVFRYLIALAGDYGPADLRRFEESSGIDLPEWYGQTPFLLTWSRADGQVFVALASDPLFHRRATQILDPDFRMQRVGYSLAGALVVLGRQSLLPIGLLIVNLLAVAVIAGLTARLAAIDRRFWWLLANPSVLIGFAGDTAEPFGIALLMLAICATSTSSAAALGAVLGVVRPDFGLALGVARKARLAGTGWALSVAAMALVIVALGRMTEFGTGNLTIPLAGYIEQWPLEDIFGRFVLLLAAAAGVATLWAAFATRGLPRISFLTSGLLVLCFGPPVLSNVANLVRVTGAVPVLWLFGIVKVQLPETPSDHQSLGTQP